MLFPEDKKCNKAKSEGGKFKRLQVPYQYRSDKFHFKTKDFKQIAHIYVQSTQTGWRRCSA